MMSLLDTLLVVALELWVVPSADPSTDESAGTVVVHLLAIAIDALA